jgi:uncharacterized protein (TIGR00251 family)
VRDPGLPHFLHTHAEGCTLSLRVQPRASSEGVVGPHGEQLKVRVTAPPVDAAANAAVVAMVARLLGRPAADVELIRGHASRSKVVLVRGVDAATAALRVAAAIRSAED